MVVDTSRLLTDQVSWVGLCARQMVHKSVPQIHAEFLLGRPEPPFRTGLCFTRDVFFVSPVVLRAPSTDRPETLPRDLNLAEFYNPTPKIRGVLPPKN